MKRVRKTNPRILKLISDLKAKARKQNVSLWREIAEKLEKPSRNYAEINMSRINRNSKENDVLIVPGKVLGAGVLKHPVTVAALSFSDAASTQISKLNGKCLTIEQLMELNPEGKGVKIFR